MSITVFNPEGMETAGNSRIMILPAVANINAITVAEWNAGTAVECATTAFGFSVDVALREARKLCDKIARQVPGVETWSVEPLVLTAGNLQTPATALTLLAKGARVWIAHRPSMDHKTAVAASQKYEAAEVEVLSQNIVPLGTEDGQEYEVTHALLVHAKNDGLLASIAGA